MNLRSGKITMAEQGQSNPETQNQGDTASPVPSVLDATLFMQQMQLLNSQIAETNKQTINSLNSLNNKIEETNRNTLECLSEKIDEVSIENKRENKILREQIELTNLTLNKKIDGIVNNLEQQILLKVNTEIDSRVTEVQEKVELSCKTSIQQIEVQVVESILLVEGKVTENIKQIEGKLTNIDEQYAMNLELLNSKVEKENDELKNEIGKINREKNIQYVCNTGIQQDMKVIFSGDRKMHPKVFIKNLQENLSFLPDHINLKAYIRNSLRGDAEIWYAIAEEKYEKFEEFRELFLSNYWGEDQQSKIRENLFNGKYIENVGLEREKYILKKYNYVRHLEPRMPDGEIVKYFARHFSDNIRDVILIQSIDTIEKLLNYLRRIDNGRVNEHAKVRADDYYYNRKTNGEYRIYDKREYQNYNRNTRDGGKIYPFNKRNEEWYNSNYRRYDSGGNNNQRRENYQNKQERKEDNNQEKEKEIKKTEWDRLDEITTAMVEPKKSNF